MRAFAPGVWHSGCSQPARMNEQYVEDIGGGAGLTGEQRAELKAAARNVEEARVLAAWGELREKRAEKSAELD